MNTETAAFRFFSFLLNPVGSRSCSHDVRRWPEPVGPIGARMRVLLDELREVHVSAEVFFDRADVAFESIRRELA